ncbi:hypothetical protein [Haloferula sp. BvORR071]|uniref:hypothetical protein n=1 Tax=Haloferula sp. BvORR071 TaxID=1396141 RepID=UPI000697F1B0|nr:hypothetical protein [Haloferula sp. BvORR071]
MDPSSPTNPYQAPLAMDLPPAPVGGSFYREGDMLVIRDGAVLPLRCVHTNRPIGPDDWTKRTKFTWTPPWVWALILIHLLVAVIVSLCIAKKAFVTYSMSREARRKLIQRRSISLLAAVAGGVGGTVSIITLNGNLALIGACLGVLTLLVSLIILVVTNALSVKKFNDGWFTLKGCSREFLDSL